MITSTKNPKVKWIRDLQLKSRYRRQEGAFVVEGVRLFEEALDAAWETRLVLFTDDLSQRGKELLERVDNLKVTTEQVSPHVMRAISDTETPQGILAVLSWQLVPLPADLDIVLVIDGLRDPGNLGSMLRTACAVGAKGVLLAPGTVDPISPKVLRAGMGAHFHLPIHVLSWDEIRFHLTGLRVYLATAGEGNLYYHADFRSPLALIVGSEAEGASLQARKMATECVQIPMPGGSESLNAAVAAGILLFEVVRQRGN